MIVLCSLALAAPHRGPFPAPGEIAWSPGRSRDEVIVKVAEGASWRPPGGEPLFGLPGLAAVQARAPGVATLSHYWLLHAEDGDGPALANRLNALPEVELAYLRPLPAPPPSDTPDFSDRQGYLGLPVDGLGFSWARSWPGGDGAGVTLADVEYSVDPRHEDLGSLSEATALGWDVGSYAFHGNSVWGEILAGDNGFGVTGMSPAVTPLIVYPYSAPGDYDVAEAILAAVERLSAGDVILVEQQAYCPGSSAYCPVSVNAAELDAISAATAAGIVVVEPAGNGDLDLDDARFEGWFDRQKQDSGSIMVGGGAGPEAKAPRSRVEGSSYGSRVDLQGWFEGIATATTGEYGGYYADLYYPDGDDTRAYTESFGGTSGASPMVAAAAAVVQGVALATRGEPLSPEEVRALLVSTGTPQPEDDAEHVGPLPDVRRALRVLLP